MINLMENSKMDKYSTYALLFILLCSMSSCSKLSVTHTECERIKEPLGIETLKPGLSWMINSDGHDVLQTAYRILVSQDETKLNKGIGDCWDSEKVTSDNSIQVFYDGLPLKPGQTYYWKVKVWDNKGNESDWSKPARWKMGLPSATNWGQAKWISIEPDGQRLVPGIPSAGSDELGDMKNILPLFRKDFKVKKDIKAATAYISGVGHFEMSLNGRKVGNHFMDPGWTDYDEYALYLAFDIIPYLQQGDNAAGIMLGNGFYHTPRERYLKCTVSYGNPKTICKILLEYNDGTTEEVVTDTSWKTSSSPITFTSIYGGEDYDARLEQDGWNKPGFADAHWQTPLVVDNAHSLRFQTSTPMAVMDTLPLKKTFLSKTGKWIYDLGQNFSGIVRLQVKANEGQTIRIWPAELLDENDDITQRASGHPFYFDYTASGDKEGECWQPTFTYYGFRYLTIENAVPYGKDNPDNLPVIQMVEGLHTRNAAKVAGQFTCSNDLFNRIYHLIDWAIRSNMASVFTDCPHREKLGWLEETQLMGPSLHYNYNVNRMFTKVIEDMRVSQLPSGLVPSISPEFVVFEGGFRDSPEWGSAYVILPWYTYEWYGDRRPIEDNYEGMKRYVNYLSSKANNYILSHGLGDWYDLGPNHPGEAQLTTKVVTATAIYYLDAVIMEKSAALLGKEEDRKYFHQLAANIKESYNKHHFNPETKQYDTGSQTANAMALYMDFVDEADKEAVFQNIINDLKARDYNQTSGEIGFRFLLKVLEEGGESETIFRMNNRDDVPGYGFQLARGATALTESWAALPYVSNNHFMLGHLLEWFYSGLGGIKQGPNSIGYKDIVIQPSPVGDITFVKSSYDCPYGTIVSDWERKVNALTMDVEVPVNTNATVYFPLKNIQTISMNGNNILDNVQMDEKGRPYLRIGSGRYRFVTDGN